jgi:hypothetical protein
MNDEWGATGTYRKSLTRENQIKNTIAFDLGEGDARNETLHTIDSNS